MLAIMALERHAMKPAHGPAVVTGANGGVGTIAISLLSRLGWHVIASTGRLSESEFLKGLGASEVIDRAELSAPGKPLGRERWAAGVDSVGSHTLANVLAQAKYGGAIAACGLAQGFDLPVTVMPFILRGVSLLGIDSVMAPRALRTEAWSRLAAELDHAKLETRTIGFDEIIAAAHEIVAGRIRGRVIVDMNP
jgi:acrylyl-CoA reductase (NADPH)